MSIAVRLRAAATAVFAMLPPYVADRVHPTRRRLFREVGVTHVGNASRRLLIGPVNSAGQAFAWARAAERLPSVSAVNVMYRGDGDVFAFPADHSIPSTFAATCRRWQDAERAAVLSEFTHVIVESGQHLFERQLPVEVHLNRVSEQGIETALLFHGSDIRTPHVHAESDPDSPFGDPHDPETMLLEQIAEKNHQLIAETGLPVFVSTLDLLPFVPGATWLPVVVDPARWAGAAKRKPLSSFRPVVVHAPSRAALKGSDLIVDTVRRLHDEGIIEYREARGIPAEDMPSFYGDADVVLDQFAMGIYGVAACEAMAAGRLVISHVDERTRAAVKEHTGMQLPILQSRAGDLEATLRDVAARPTPYIDIAEAGPVFVDAVHDGELSARALQPFLGVE